MRTHIYMIRRLMSTKLILGPMDYVKFIGPLLYLAQQIIRYLREGRMSKKDSSAGLTMGQLINLWAEVERDYNVRIKVSLLMKDTAKGESKLQVAVSALEARLSSKDEVIDSACMQWPTNSHKTFCGLLYYLTLTLTDSLEATEYLGKERSAKAA